MRLCAHVRYYRGIAKHLWGNGVCREHISRLEVCLIKIAYTTSESIMLGPSSWNLANFDNRTILQCFSCLQLSNSRKRLQSYEELANWQKIFACVPTATYNSWGITWVVKHELPCNYSWILVAMRGVSTTRYLGNTTLSCRRSVVIVIYTSTHACRRYATSWQGRVSSRRICIIGMCSHHTALPMVA